VAKGKFEYWRTKDGLLQIAAWARNGLIDEQIAHNMGIRRSTLSEWKKRFPDIADALKKNKNISLSISTQLFPPLSYWKELV